MRSTIVAAVVLLLAGCSGFKLGTMVYLPHGQVGTVSVMPPEVAASGAR